MQTYKITDSVTGKTYKLTGDSPPTEQELNNIFEQQNLNNGLENIQDSNVKDNKSIEPVGIFGTIFAEPSAASSREVIRNKPITGAFGPFAGPLALTGIMGSELRNKASSGLRKPSESETFTEEAVRKAIKPIWDKAKERKGLYAPDKLLGKLRFGAEALFSASDDFQRGYAADFITNPTDVLLSFADIASGLKKGVKGAKIGKDIISKYKRAIKPTRKVLRKTDITNVDNRIANGLDAVSDFITESNKHPKNIDDFLNIINDTKKTVLAEYNNLRNIAKDGEAFIDGANVGQRIFESQASKASKLANPNLQKRAFQTAADFAKEGKISLDTAEETIRKLNAQRPKGLTSIIDDVSNAQLLETTASALRKELDDAILKSTGKKYQPLKNMYGSLVELEKDVSNKVLSLGKKSKFGLINQLSESLDNVPLIYGIFSGNIPLTGAALSQKLLKAGITSIKSTDNQIKAMFKAINKAKRIKKAIPTRTLVGQSRKLIQKDK